jgi:hypothetical protein
VTLTAAKDDSGESDDYEIVSRGLLEARGDTPILLEFVEAAFDELVRIDAYQAGA